MRYIKILLSNILTGTKLSREAVPLEIKQSLKNKGTPIITDHIVSAISNLQKEPTLSGLFNLQKFTEWGQGKLHYLIFYLIIEQY